MTAGQLLWPDPLVLTPDILHGALAGWGIPASWGRTDASVFRRLYRVDSGTGEIVRRGAGAERVPWPPPGLYVEEITAAVWNRLPWGEEEHVDRVIQHKPGRADRHEVSASTTLWDAGGRAKPTWLELKPIVVRWWLDGATDELLGKAGEWDVDSCAREAMERLAGETELPFGVAAKPRSVAHVGAITSDGGTFPAMSMPRRGGGIVEIADEAQARKLATAAIAATNQLETARNRLVQEAMVPVRAAADRTGGLDASASDVARLNARTRALNRAHQLLGPETIGAHFKRILDGL